MTKGQAAQAERDAEHARANLEGSLDRLRSRLTPGSMLDEGLSLVRDGGVAQFGRNLGRQAKANPLPIALVGAGLAWLMLARRERPVHEIEYEHNDRSRDGGPSTTEAFADGASRAAARMTGGMHAAQARAGEAYDAAADAAADASDQVRHATDATMQRAARLQKAAGDRITTLMREQPLVLGALGLALGAAIGAALPRTDAEDRVMGAASDQVKAGALDAMQEQAGKAAQVAERVYDSAVQEGEKAAADAGWVEPSQDKPAEFNAPQKPATAG
ncbi:MAG: hypothetical protein AB7V13_17630 [Pseudorhodoplanes sp.]|uniref:hypothetical protein n=1 Tax=Pseudorhodoplanes sp. TaxID=1934341 RepID=UPI003D0F2CE6